MNANAVDDVVVAAEHSIPRGSWLIHAIDAGGQTHLFLVPFGRVPAVPYEWIVGLYCHPDEMPALDAAAGERAAP